MKKIIKIDKRVRLLLSTLLLGFLLLVSTFYFFDKAFIFIPLLIVFSYFLTYFAILEGIEKIEWLTLFLMPVILSVSFYLFYFIFPGRWLTRLPFTVLYVISIYAALLCANIFNVGAEKNLQLYRAAFSTNFLYQTITSFMVFNLLFILKQSFLINALVSGVVSFILCLHLLWTIKLDCYVGREYLNYALFVALIQLELALLLSFIPLSSAISALFMTASYYSLTGLTYNYLDQRLFKETIREYLIVLGFVLLISLLSLG